MMKQHIKKTCKLVGIFVMWLFAVIAALIIVLPMVLNAGVAWVYSEKGQHFLQQLVESQIESYGYSVDMEGFKADIPSDLYIEQLIIKGADNKATIIKDLHINIDIKNLARKIAAVISMDSIVFSGQKKLSFVSVNININEFRRGDFKLTAKFFEKDVSAQTNFILKNKIVNLNNVKLSAPDFNGSGSLSLNMRTKKLEGELLGSLSSLQHYYPFIGTGHSIKSAKFDAQLSHDKFTQKAEINLNASGYNNSNIGVAIKKITLNSNFTKQGDSYKLSGIIHPENIEINIPEQFGSKIDQINIINTKNDGSYNKATVGGNIDLDIVVDAPNKIFVRGWGLDSEFGGKIKISNTLNAPKFDGSLSSLRGRYNEFGKSFNLAKAKLNFAGTIPPSPSLDIIAETELNDITAQILITGSVLKPKIGFASIPTKPADEVMSYILFGEDMGSLSPFQALQLAQTLQRFTGNGGGQSFDPVGSLRDATGLDSLRLDTNEDGSATVGADKYITDKVYLKFETGVEGNGSNVKIEAEIAPNIILESEVGQDARGGAGIFWKKDY